MRISRSFGKTLRETPTEAETISHSLLVRAGFVQQMAAGIYSSLPMGWRSQQKITNIIRDEMIKVGAMEVSMPVVQPRELWEESGRAESMIPPLATFKDRRGRHMVLAPTHEEAITEMVKLNVNSYRDLPVTLFQIQTKFRDEPRPRAGLLRVREFEMKDAYSFDSTDEGLDKSYEAMAQAYRNIYARCGIKAIEVDADSGGIGGKDSTEFVLIAENGEDVILLCSGCDYAANVEKAEFNKIPLTPEEPQEIKEISTPGVKTIEQLGNFLDVPPKKTIKTVFYVVGDEIVMASIRGDLEINVVKLRNALGGIEPRLATKEEVNASGFVAGSASVIGLSGVSSIIDDSVSLGNNFIAGANREDHHICNVNYPRDFENKSLRDIATASKGDSCQKCGGHLDEYRGIEVGHIFKVGTGYSKTLGANFVDESSETHPIIMGCYGIGIGRLLAAIVESNHDEHGMILPASIAPFHVYLTSLNVDDSSVIAAADDLYKKLQNRQIEVLYDDRDEKPGVKFNDADLLGLPLRVVVSRRGLAQGQIELKTRRDLQVSFAPIPDAVSTIEKALGINSN